MTVSSPKLLSALSLAALALFSQATAAKTLVYCSEGSPENFTPALNTTGTSFDAARPVCTCWRNSRSSTLGVTVVHQPLAYRTQRPEFGEP